MPEIGVVFFAESASESPLLEWLDGLPAKAQDKCIVKIERLAHLGHELRRPEGDYLRDGIFELRASLDKYNTGCCIFFMKRGQSCHTG